MTAATFTQALDIDPAPFVRRDGRGVARLELAVKGMRCAGCIAKIERGLKALPGVEDARVNLSTAKLSVRWREGRTSAERDRSPRHRTRLSGVSLRSRTR